MHTVILSDDGVAAYARDFLARWRDLGINAPCAWFSLGLSGDKLVKVLIDLMQPQELQRLSFHRIGFDRTSKTVSVREDERAASFPECALLIDGPIHSGSSMLNAARWLLSHGVKNIVSYGLVVKKTSEFVPTYFGLMIGEHDRAYFQLPAIPNHRLQRKPPFGILRTISQSDADDERQTLKTGVESLDKLSLADLVYESVTKLGHHVYLFETSEGVAGFVHFYVVRSRVVVDAVAVDENYRGFGIGAALIRWVENWARHHRMMEIALFAIENRASFYEERGFIRTAKDPLRLGRGETYYEMTKRLLYNIKPKDEAA